MTHSNVLISNFLSLTIVQIANYILPLITVPYIVRIIGPEKFGLINFAQAFVGYFMVLTNFGVNLSGAREVATIRDNKERLSNVFASFIFGRLCLSIIASIIFFLLLFFIPKLSADYLLFIITFSIVFTEVLFPTWLFQGLEKMQYIAIINFIGKFISTVLIFIIIKQADDYIYIPLLNLISSLIIGITALFIVYSKLGLKFRIPSINDVYTSLKKSFTIFISDVYVSFYTASYPVVLGFLTNYNYVGYYTAAHKIIQAWLEFQNLLVTTTYPRISKLAQESKERSVVFLKKMTVVCLIFSIPSTILFCFYADFIIVVILGDNFIESVPVLQIMSTLCVLILMNVHLTLQGMLPFRQDKHFNYARLSGGIIALCLIFPLSIYWKHIGTSLTFVLSELGVFVTSIYLLSISKIKFLELQQFKKILLFTALVLLITSLSLTIRNYFAGIAVAFTLILFIMYKLFGNEYFLSKRDLNV